MARGKKSGPSRIDLRRQAEAAEAREKDDDEVEDEEEEADDEDAGDDEDEDGGKKKTKAKAKAKAKPKKKEPAKAKAPSKRTRTPKEVRTRAVWVVFDNASKRIETFPYPRKADAEKFLEQKREEKKTTFYLQLVKEPMEA